MLDVDVGSDRKGVHVECWIYDSNALMWCLS